MGLKGWLTLPAMHVQTKGARHAALQIGDIDLVGRWVVTGVSQPILATGKLLRGVGRS